MEKTKFTEKLAYAVGAFPEVVNTVVATFLTIFYTDSMGMLPGVIGTMFLVSRVFDGISDLAVGSLIDRTKTKWGKARPWLLWSAVPMAISITLLTMVPQNASDTVKLIYAILTYNLFTTVMYTITGVARNSLLPLMTQDFHDRAGIAAAAMFVSIGGAVFGSAMTYPFIIKMGGDLRAWRLVFLIYGIASAACLLLNFFGTKERVVSVASVEQKGNEQKMSFTEELKVFFSNKYLIIALFTGLLMNFATNVSSAAQTYFFQYVMNDMMLMTSIGLLGVVPMFISILFLATPVIRKFGKRISVFIGTLGQIAAFATKVIAGLTGNTPLMMIGTVVGSLCTGMLAVPVGTLAADAIDYGEYKTNKRIEGVGSAVTSFAQKLTAGIASGAVGWTLQLTGYVAEAAQTAATKMGIITLYGIMPGVAELIIFLIFLFIYRYDKEEPMVIAELNRRKVAAAEGDN